MCNPTKIFIQFYFCLTCLKLNVHEKCNRANVKLTIPLLENSPKLSQDQYKFFLAVILLRCLLTNKKLEKLCKIILKLELKNCMTRGLEGVEQR